MLFKIQAGILNLKCEWVAIVVLNLHVPATKKEVAWSCGGECWRLAPLAQRARSRRPSLRLGYRGEDQLISSALYRRDLESSRGDSESSRGNSDSSKGTAGSLLPLGSKLENQGPGLTGPGPLMLSLRHWQCQSRRSRTWLEMNLVRCRSACKKTVQLRIHVRCI